jgi:hypothetical protein
MPRITTNFRKDCGNYLEMLLKLARFSGLGAAEARRWTVRDKPIHFWIYLADSSFSFWDWVAAGWFAAG